MENDGGKRHMTEMEKYLDLEIQFKTKGLYVYIYTPYISSFFIETPYI